MSGIVGVTSDLLANASTVYFGGAACMPNRQAESDVSRGGKVAGSGGARGGKGERTQTGEDKRGAWGEVEKQRDTSAPRSYNLQI